ncbi:hypothetical protein L1987_07246 [Smallanthus sonchifolius]|uniref:Uncharacterized protein n=1 Tax=Smallanthus sonchifolius TaxID=185202 RepID=A0ACB9K0A7_9ASTR|nr:hypothetical protein L1987_07246 [Smallanthus sonchifolius]
MEIQLQAFGTVSLSRVGKRLKGRYREGVRKDGRVRFSNHVLTQSAIKIGESCCGCNQPVFLERKQRETHVKEVIAEEEASFVRTLLHGIERFKNAPQDVQGKIFNGQVKDVSLDSQRAWVVGLRSIIDDKAQGGHSRPGHCVRHG